MEFGEQHFFWPNIFQLREFIKWYGVTQRDCGETYIFISMGRQVGDELQPNLIVKMPKSEALPCDYLLKGGILKAN